MSDKVQLRNINKTTTCKPNANDHDRLFADDSRAVDDFAFDQNVVTVFDDMVERSVPYYGEFQRLTGELAADFAVPGTGLFDLGCATGTTLLALDGVVDPEVEFVGIDSSNEMLERARQKLADSGTSRRYRLVNGDLNQHSQLDNASVAVLILTLQFVRPLNREKVLRQIHEGLNANGCLILVEKITQTDSLLNRIFTKNYYDFKRRNGYSDVEIALKREALENVLIPYRHEENVDLLHAVGFRRVAEFFRWYNFCGVVAGK